MTARCFYIAIAAFDFLLFVAAAGRHIIYLLARGTATDCFRLEVR